MMGDKKPGDYKKVILAAFADKVSELKRWLDREMANGGDSAGPKTLGKLVLLRKTLREAQRNREKAMMGNKKAVKNKEKSRVRKTKKPPAA